MNIAFLRHNVSNSAYTCVYAGLVYVPWQLLWNSRFFDTVGLPELFSIRHPILIKKHATRHCVFCFLCHQNTQQNGTG